MLTSKACGRRGTVESVRRRWHRYLNPVGGKFGSGEVAVH